MPSSLISVEMVALLLILILPALVFLNFFSLVFVSSIKSTKSLILTCERKIPICTKRLPLASGSVCTVPFKFMLKTLTESPIRRFFGAFVFAGALGFIAIFFSTSFILLRSLVRSFSMVLLSALTFPYFWKLRIDSSATSFASRRILWASSFASRRIFSRLLSRRSCFSSKRFFKVSISAL